MSDSTIISSALKKSIQYFFEEDDLSRNFFYLNSLPTTEVTCSLYVKSDLVIAGLPHFVEVFKYLGAQSVQWDEFHSLEGRFFSKSKTPIIQFKLPFSIALTGERIALNLLQHASSIATFTQKFVERARLNGIAILDTRKTTPGLRSLEKYAVRVGGGHNHRLGQTDVWMVKDNHKSFFGGLKQAIDYFRLMQGYYTPIQVEVHCLEELKLALDLKVEHIMLDNFTPDLVKQAIAMKTSNVTYEISGGINLGNLENYLIKGVDAISIGALTYSAPHVDLSLKYARS